MRRRLTILLVFLLLGAVVNVAVAWGCALWSETEYWEDRSDWMTEYPIEESMRPVPQSVRRIHEYRMPRDFRPTGERRYGLTGFGVNWYIISAISTEGGGMESISTTGLHAGWPVHGLRADSGSRLRFPKDAVGGPETLMEWDAGWLLSDPRGRNIPYLPLWPGLAVNTALYAAALWLLLLAGPRTLRRQLRHRRGRCVKCGYDLRGDLDAGCPECGWNREGAEASGD